MTRPIHVIRRVAPHARAEYLRAFEDGDGQLAKAGINTPKRLAHFLAQVLHETGGLTVTEESGNYRAQRICEVWPHRFPTIASAEPYAHNAERLFNHVYANRMGNGPPSTGDGFRYRGRGVMQTTGRESYRKYGRRFGVDFERHPELVLSADHALKPALAEWFDKKCNELADAGDIHAITRRINGGLTGFSERVRWLHMVTPVIGDKVDLKVKPPFLEPLPAPKPKLPLPKVQPKHVGIGAIIAAVLAWLHAGPGSHAPWWVWVGLAGVALVGVMAFFIKHGHK